MSEGYYTYYRQPGVLGGKIPPAVKTLLIITCSIYIFELLARNTGAGQFVIAVFSETPALTFGRAFLWQPITYMFLHDPGDPSHLLFNMLALWMFGSVFERLWGTRRFLKFYFTCGVAAGIIVALSGFLSERGWVTATLGQSGAIYGLIAAFGVVYAEQYIYFFAVIPIKAKVFVWLIIGISILYFLAGSPYSLPAHLGGLAAGWLLVTGNWDPRRMYYRFRLFLLERKRRRLRVVRDDRETYH